MTRLQRCRYLNQELYNKLRVNYRRMQKSSLKHRLPHHPRVCCAFFLLIIIMGMMAPGRSMPMPEPPPPPPGYVAPTQFCPPAPQVPRPPIQEYRQRPYPYPISPNSHPIPSPPQQWSPAALHYRLDGSHQPSWQQRNQPSYGTPCPPIVHHGSPTIQHPPLVQQPRSNAMSQVYRPEQRNDYVWRQGDFEMEWLRPEVPSEMFGLIGETLLCPLKVTLYILGELFRKAA